MSASVDVLVVGAGMAGLVAARELRDSGRSVRVLDKGRGVGGRLATRRLGAATLDHGAQFFTARAPRFRALVAELCRAGVVDAWPGWARATGAPETRWIGRPAMNAIAKHLARDLDVVSGCAVTRLEARAGGWRAVTADGAAVEAGAVLVTAPAPQAVALLDADAAARVPAGLGETEAYEPCIAVMAVPRERPAIPAPGGLAPGEGPVGWIADNHAKGVSAVPAVTLHATPAFSRSHWSEDREAVAAVLLESARPWLAGPMEALSVHGWRYARACPAPGAEPACAVIGERPPLVLAGDAFAGPRVEGAALSGWAAAAALQGLAQRDSGPAA